MATIHEIFPKTTTDLRMDSSVCSLPTSASATDGKATSFVTSGGPMLQEARLAEHARRPCMNTDGSTRLRAATSYALATGASLACKVKTIRANPKSLLPPMSPPRRMHDGQARPAAAVRAEATP